MRAFLAAFVALLTLLLAMPIVAEDGSEDPVSVSQHLIEAQIKAFLNDDAEGAYSYASPAIRTLFPDRAAFFAMVKRSYAPVYRPGNYAFGRSRVIGGGAMIYQEVVISSRDGKDWTAIYQVERQPDGSFAINGVQILPQADSKGI